jgi:hypothetical protein
MPSAVVASMRVNGGGVVGGFVKVSGVSAVGVSF